MATEAMAPTVNGEPYEVAKARLDLVEAEAELAAATTSSAMVMALDRADDARYRLSRWRATARDRAARPESALCDSPRLPMPQSP